MRVKTEILLIVSILNIIPFTIIIIGDWLGASIQSPWFTYIISYQGTSLISAYSNLGYVTSGILSPKSTISIVLWETGTVLLAAATCLLFYEHTNASPRHKVSGTLTILAGIAMLASLVQQYGPLLHGPAGIAIPVGLPLVFAVGWWVYRYEEPVDPSPAGEQAAGEGEQELQ
ncbi:hypothetical protein [Methanosphaerula palustris]|uniref:DUF8050 domain-containing protein n=1 Tax=Methanosphaerula palustris (strain ATCC BAA-1556 / DSM 19958 / E1-9c) TaxID=521011 RepID=B8GEJ5_METPE|nr:hypothetical protein [Methanosphaerula palustris]ACL17696.1 conserved hypothetical protein [Methanosphaerula palustris E1-9c]